MQFFGSGKQSSQHRVCEHGIFGEVAGELFFTDTIHLSTQCPDDHLVLSITLISTPAQHHHGDEMRKKLRAVRRHGND